MAQKTVVGLHGDMTINDQKVGVDAVFGQDFFLQLAQEINLGSPISFAYWLREQYQVDGPGMDLLKVDGYKSEIKTLKDFNAAWKSDRKGIEVSVRQNLEKKGIPGPAVKLMTTALLAEVVITDLLVAIKQPATQGAESEKKLKFGLAINFGVPLSLLPGIDLDRISLLILSAPENDFKFPEREKSLGKPIPLREAASGYIDFTDAPAAGSKITLGGTDWGFLGASAQSKPNSTKITTGDLPATLSQLAKDLGQAEPDGIVAQCSYAAEGNRLKVVYKEPGVKGNTFKLAADDNSHGTASGATLSGGTSPLGEKAAGSIEFKAPIPAGTIAIGGADITLSAAPAEKDLNKAIETLVAEIDKTVAANADKPITQYIYQASGKKLTFAAKDAGKAGNKNDFLPAKTAFIETMSQPAGGVDPTPV
jgi:hypothetical protein